MTKAKSDRQTALSKADDHVHLADLHLEWFEDKGLAQDVAEDCLRLFRASEADFADMLGQQWYKRLWATLSGGNTRKLAAGCQNLAQAQQLLLTVLQTHARANARSNALMMLGARGLRQLESQQSQVVATFLNIADRVELLEREMALHRDDPSDELTWSDERRLLLYKVMVMTARADGTVSQEEMALLRHKIKVLRLSGEYRAEAMKFTKRQDPIDEDLKRLDSYKMRLVMYRHAIGVAYAEDRKSTRLNSSH
jgi:uncharacterized tellurite resistance protein B-like protein